MTCPWNYMIYKHLQTNNDKNKNAHSTKVVIPTLFFFDDDDKMNFKAN